MTDILISGAGIAGPALAYWLRAAGHSVTVVERAPTARPGGQAVDLRGAGRTVIERMGLMDRVRSVSLDQRGIAWVAASGRITARMPVEAFDGKGIISEIEVLRDDLAHVLHEATAGGVEYRFGDTITALRQDTDGVDVSFEQAPPRRFDLVVGADGLYSPVRAMAFGGTGLHPLGCAMAWFSVPTDRLGEDLGGWYLTHNASGGRVASVRPGRTPDMAKGGLGLRVDAAAPLPRDAAGQRDLLERRFADVGWKAPQLVEAMRTAPDFAFTSVAQVRLPRWSQGRVVLIGDAAACPTPLTGLGTSVALVQAYVLAGEIAAAVGDHQVAFDRYEQVTRPYVATAQKLPPGGVNGYAPNSALLIRLQALSMRAMTRWPMRPLLERQFAKAGDIALPDYAPTGSTPARSTPAG
jgi:2-polyprenyl-6-methoxyphenol hydroxylase-like FAD-dependent oxidoreductase